jgi:hypothetical protein
LIPGTNQSNTYLFLDMTQASTPEEVGLLGKYEWLIGTTEVGVSTWLSPHRSSKHGVDVSTRLGDYDVIAELALEAGPSWAISPLVGVTRQFHWERPNRVTFHYEAYRRTTSANTLYQAMMLTITEFPIYPLTYSFNYVQNVTDSSGIVSTGVAYTVVEGLQLSGNLLVFVGPKGGEYSPNGEAVGVLLQGVLRF